MNDLQTIDPRLNRQAGQGKRNPGVRDFLGVKFMSSNAHPRYVAQQVPAEYLQRTVREDRVCPALLAQ